MKTIIAGSRDNITYDDVVAAMKLCGWVPTEVVSGTARGVDIFGEIWAEENNIPIKRFRPDWNKHGKGAGFIRNAQMAEYADALVAIWDGQSKGTKNMIDSASKKGLNVFIHNISFKHHI